jgi:hypothetical protein
MKLLFHYSNKTLIHVNRPLEPRKGQGAREELMDGDVYFAEHIIRDRLAEARARAKFAALHGEANQGSPRAGGFGHRLVELGRSLVKQARTEARTLDVRSVE